jgi:hypothetical protein
VQSSNSQRKGAAILERKGRSFFLDGTGRIGDGVKLVLKAILKLFIFLLEYY